MIPAAHRPLFHRAFAAYSRRLLAGRFHAVWTRGELSASPEPYVMAVQHVAWWDPLLLIYLSKYAWEPATYFVMMDERNLKKYPFFRYVGAFGVDLSTPEGRQESLAYAQARATEQNARVVLFAQGLQRPMDLRPIVCRPGARKIATDARCPIVPIALRYEFLEDEYPDVFVSHGAPRWVHTDESSHDLVGQWLTEEADSLRDDVHAGRLDRFVRRLEGRGERDPLSEQSIGKSMFNRS
ncbi:MAG: lysophospholipid acyltransferase family protein [Deltaproteobacteria bacterium]|nr:lysophospholipid acyltransferase family protein [Deltaproteobacteria bacterium]